MYLADDGSMLKEWVRVVKASIKFIATPQAPPPPLEHGQIIIENHSHGVLMHFTMVSLALGVRHEPPRQSNWRATSTVVREAAIAEKPGGNGCESVKSVK